MRLKFENQAYQLQAVASTVALFAGMKSLDLATMLQNKNELLSYDVVANGLQLDDALLLQNLQRVQVENYIENYSSELNYGDYENIPNFSIEMETGTGKTYVYLRTAFELNKHYGLCRFIIVVPSDAIRVGTIKALEITAEHFKAEYNNISYDYYPYDSEKISKVRDFATTNSIQIMVMTIAAFNKSKNNIYAFKDKFGEYRPIDLISAVNPIVIIDEPQSVDNTANAIEAIKNLNPSFILRYSATHKNDYHQIYKLDAIDAYNQKLVKQIEVASLDDAEFNNTGAAIPYIKVVEITAKLELSLELDIQDTRGKITRKVIKKIAKDTDLQEKTKNDKYYGYIVEDYSRDYGLKLSCLDNEIAIGESIGNEISQEQKTKIMLRLAIENHIDKELRLAARKIKVLSLFFIDRVADYRIHADDGAIDGWLAQAFIEELKLVLATPKGARYVELCQNTFGINLANDEELIKLHNGYFAKDKKGNYKDLKDDSTADAVDAYDLIMRDKEKLLDSKEPLRFIFSHSALKEGWDNPNVFQVCVLQDSKNQFKRRQQIGRGLRLCVNQFGERVFDDKVNTLTVIASESYNAFADNLQREYEASSENGGAGIKFGIVQKSAFVNCLLHDNLELSFDAARKISEDIHAELTVREFIDSNNKVTDKCKMQLQAGVFELNSPEIRQYQILTKEILTKLTIKLPIKNQRDKQEIQINLKVYNNPAFKQLWKKISAKTIYSVSLDTDKLINSVVTDINANLEVKNKALKITRSRINIDESGISTELMAQNELILQTNPQIDLVNKLALATGLTKKTIITILKQIAPHKLEMYKLNIDVFIEQVTAIINIQKSKLIVDGIKYTKVADLSLQDSVIGIEDHYLQERINEDIDHGYVDNNGGSNLADARYLKVAPELLANKFLYNVLRFDSSTEAKFLADCLLQDKVKLISKLPSWFKVNTPLGAYNPDWALLVNEENKDEVYFIAETKPDNFLENGRAIEKAKTVCGEKHFQDTLSVKYQVLSNADQI